MLLIPRRGNRENSVFSFYFVAGMLDYSIRVILVMKFPDGIHYIMHELESEK